jgi:ATP-dependent Lhr-like helicase
MTARMNAGVIPDRGLYAVYLGEGGPRVGELDEEMVYESRKGDVIQLGASSWRIEEITRDRVLVSPAPGEAGRLPFWRGDAPGRSLELGTSLGEFLRDCASQAQAALPAWLRAHAPLDESAARELAAYIGEQRRVSALPTDRTLVVERFRDELGDWRLCLLSPFGARVHAPWAIALQQILSARAGFEVQVLYTDDGIVLRFADTDALPDLTTLLPEPEEVTRLVTDQLPHTALFAGLFRENAARALLMPRRQVRGRRPLWAQRLKAQQLLATVSRYPDFPIVLETYRQALSDLFDLDGLRRVLGDIRAGRIRVREVETPSASPFARSLVFAYVAANLYAGDVPLAEKRAQAMTLDRRMLSELLGEAELAELLDAQAIGEVEAMLQRLDPEHQAQDADALHDLLRTLGDLSSQEIAQRCAAPAGGQDEGWQHWLTALAASRRAVQVRVSGETRWIAAEDAGLYRDALGVPHPPGLPADCIALVEDALIRLLRRWVRRNGPFPTELPARRFGLAPAQVEPVLRLLERDGQLLRGRIRPDAHGDEWVDAEVLKRLKRASLAHLRRQAAPQEAAALGRFLAGWQGLTQPAPGRCGTDTADWGGEAGLLPTPAAPNGGPVRRPPWGPPTPERLLEAVLPLEALALPWSTLSLTLLPMRLPGFTPEHLDALAASGLLVWVGVAPLGPRDGKVMLLRRDRSASLLNLADHDPPTPLHACILERLATRGASFLTELESAVARALPDAGVRDFEAALWDLVWAGRVTNDSFAPLRQLLRGAGRGGGSHRHARQTLAGGRWSLVADLTQPQASVTEQAVAWAEVLLGRYGIVSREAVRAEQPAPGWQAIRLALRAMEESGRLRRGYFVEGLSGVQYARPDALERLRPLDEEQGARILAAVDPANPYGALLPWPEGGEGETRPRRVPGAWVVLVDGRLALYLQPGGHGLLTFPGQLPDPQTQLATALAALARLPPGGRRHFVLTRVDGVAVQDSPLHATLMKLGYTSEYGGMGPPRA